MLKSYWLTRLCPDLSRKTVRRRLAAPVRTHQAGLESLEVRLLLSGDHAASLIGGHDDSMTGSH
ncbi:MAG: hypothetical protein VB858_03145, partial [Planctomycetaceae bacterium]